MGAWLLKRSPFRQCPRKTFSPRCVRRPICPSCHQKRGVEFGEWLGRDALEKIPHRHFVFSIPEILRRYFLYARKLLADLSRCARESLQIFLRAVGGDTMSSDFPGNSGCAMETVILWQQDVKGGKI